MSGLRIAVIGCTFSTKRCLEEIERQGADVIAGIITLHSSKAATKSRFVSLEDFAAKGIPVYYAEKTNDPAVLEFLKSLNADLLLEVGWSHWIGADILSAPKQGTIGFHNSYLPKNQGAASLNWALIRDEKEWGTTMFWLAENIDAGDIIARRSYPVTDEDDVNTLFGKADDVSVEMLREMLPLLRSGTAPRITQNPAEVTKLPRRKPEDGKIDWSKPGREIWNLIRALKKPYPPAFTFAAGKRVMVCDAALLSDASQGPGIIQSVDGRGAVVGAGEGSVLLKRLEIEGGQEADAAAVLHTLGLTVSQAFDV